MQVVGDGTQWPSALQVAISADGFSRTYPSLLQTTLHLSSYLFCSCWKQRAGSRVLSESRPAEKCEHVRPAEYMYVQDSRISISDKLYGATLS